MKKKLNLILIGFIAFSLVFVGCSKKNGNKETSKESASEESTSEKNTSEKSNSEKSTSEESTNENQKVEEKTKENQTLGENKNQVSEGSYDYSYFHEGEYLDEKHVRLRSPEDCDITTAEIYYINIYNLTETSFDFNIYDLDDKLVFKDHTAEITGNNNFTYYGKDYTLTFSSDSDGYLNLVGFPSAGEGSNFSNNEYLGVN